MRISIDWDGTCVENVWPAMGAWLPGAKEALVALDEAGFELIIFSCRVAPVEFGAEDQPRAAGEAEREVAEIKAMLADAGLEHVEVWTRPYKPPAVFYIDDRSVPFRGSWGEVLDFINRVLSEVKAS